VISVRNVFNIDFRINIGKIADMERKAIKIENCPGVIYRMQPPIKTAMLFQSGKMILMGAKE
jgi:TATA-box binding protein (TBP) (component of TFIID and TFIIIB)